MWKWSDGKQKEEEEDSIGRGISERWLRERENNENNMGGSEIEETFFFNCIFFLDKI